MRTEKYLRQLVELCRIGDEKALYNLAQILFVEACETNEHYIYFIIVLAQAIDPVEALDTTLVLDYEQDENSLCIAFTDAEQQAFLEDISTLNDAWHKAPLIFINCLFDCLAEFCGMRMYDALFNTLFHQQLKPLVFQQLKKVVELTDGKLNVITVANFQNHETESILQPNKDGVVNVSNAVKILIQISRLPGTGNMLERMLLRLCAISEVNGSNQLMSTGLIGQKHIQFTAGDMNYMYVLANATPVKPTTPS